MTELLTELLEAGLIEKMGGDDTRLEKIEKAAGAIAQGLREQPPRLIRAILTGIDPDVPADDPAIVQAKRALVAEWKSMNSVYTDTPVRLLRSILLEACNQVGEEGDKAAILWLTAADMLPLQRLGREEQPVRKMLETFASRTEEMSVAIPDMPKTSESDVVESLTMSLAVVGVDARKVDRNTLRQRVAATAGPNFHGQTLNNPNPHWSNQAQHWSFEFAERMGALLADELDALAQDMRQQVAQIGQSLEKPMSEIMGRIESKLRSQELLLQAVLEAGERRICAEKRRLDALWWSEALYSSSARQSYREMNASLAAVVMAIDLLTSVSSPSPASVGYMLAETVNRLPNAGFERKLGMRNLLVELRELRGHLPSQWASALADPPAEGRLSLRDTVVQSLQDREWDVDTSMRRAGLTSDMSLSLPVLAHAIFRQEQAVRLAESIK
ncbi:MULTISPECIES: GTPase-associated system all-helical protein GASH [Sorangium]|uniref:GTPase-associated system helical domain-containing protein n=1 Tax=Sorangium cellulosum TaxID=56 RepID=A0A4P2QEV1_SORCE|nr:MULTISPECIES: GTPase-associated system all-helical protein GASH [Sorangium]AUX28370.1 uncharacterized protein SOCE836_004400 [Sorangium cellulosum]WCQ87762.1 hypothetical protein NQZ70_00425 [Sorangium sp. Soce836]